MIQIKKGSKTLMVTKGAFDSTFKSQGWTAEMFEKPEQPEPIQEEQKPISKMGVDELKLRAIDLGIDLDGVRKVGELRKLIVEAEEMKEE